MSDISELPARISDVPPYYKKAYLQVREALGPFLKEEGLLPFISIGETSLEISFKSRDGYATSPVAIYFEGPEATGLEKASWNHAGLECQSFSSEPIGDNGWSVDIPDDDSENIEFATFYSGKSVNELLVDLVRRVEALGVFVERGARPFKVTEEFAAIYEDFSEAVLEIDGMPEINVSRSARGIESYGFKDAWGRRIAIALPKGSQEWSCYVNDRIVGRGEWMDLFQENVRLEEKEVEDQDEDEDEDEDGRYSYY